MPNDGPERFEAYLELERFLAELQAGKAAHPPQQLTPSQARIYHMALLFHAATSGGCELRRAFAVRLQLQLEEELRHQSAVDPAHPHPSAHCQSGDGRTPGRDHPRRS